MSSSMNATTSAQSFDAILKRTKAKYVLRLTATPIRRDDQQPIIFMLCGPIRCAAAKPASAPNVLKVASRTHAFSRIVFRHRVHDQARTDAIAVEVLEAFKQGRKILLLTERTEYLDASRLR